MFNKSWVGQDSNTGPLVSLVTTLSTVPKPMPWLIYSLFFIFFKNGQPRPLFCLFSVFSKNNTLFTTSSIRCRDSNPRPLEHELSPITTIDLVSRPNLLLVRVDWYPHFYLGRCDQTQRHHQGEEARRICSCCWHHTRFGWKVGTFAGS